MGKIHTNHKIFLCESCIDLYQYLYNVYIMIRLQYSFSVHNCDPNYGARRCALFNSILSWTQRMYRAFETVIQCK